MRMAPIKVLLFMSLCAPAPFGANLDKTQIANDDSEESFVSDGNKEEIFQPEHDFHKRNKREGTLSECSGSSDDWDCCGGQCHKGEGDCDKDSDCVGDLICGKDNCRFFNPEALANIDCCVPATFGYNEDYEDYCTGQCGIGEGDCDEDSDCLGSLICGKDNCRDFNPDTTSDTADCCTKGDYCPGGYKGITNNLDGTGVSWNTPHLDQSTTIFHCAAICDARIGCTGFEFSREGRCGTYTGGRSNILEDANRTEEVSFWRSCIKETECSGSSDDWDCCSDHRQCQIGQGDCDYDSDCLGNLICGKDNCRFFNPLALLGSDCCVPATFGYNKKYPNYCTGQCGIGEGDCDKDSDCLGGLICGTNNCRDFNPNTTSDTADCCTKGQQNSLSTYFIVYPETCERSPLPSNEGKVAEFCINFKTETITENQRIFCEFGTSDKREALLCDQISSEDTDHLLNLYQTRTNCNFDPTVVIDGKSGKLVQDKLSKNCVGTCRERQKEALDAVDKLEKVADRVYKKATDDMRERVITNFFFS